jgi:hypothetical protein
MDHGSPRLVFLVVVAFIVVAIATVVTLPRRPPADAAAADRP